MQSVFNNGSVYGQYGGGYQYENPNTLQWTNPLTPEDEKELHRGAQALSLDIPKEAMLRAKCTHRDPATHNFTIRPADDGNGYVCMKCGAHFNVVDGHSMKEINEIIGGAIDILQTTKMMYVDMTPEVIQAYFVILPFLELAPKMYEAAVNTFKKVMPNTTLGQNNVPGNYYNAYYNMVGNAGANPWMNNPMGQMMYPNQAMPPMGQMGGMGTVPDMNNPMMANPMQMTMPGAVKPPVDTTASTVGQQPAEGTPVTTSSKYALG